MHLYQCYLLYGSNHLPSVITFLSLPFLLHSFNTTTSTTTSTTTHNTATSYHGM